MSKKQINGWEIKDFTKYLIKKEHFLDQAAYLRHEVDPDFDKMENTEPILPILRCNSTTTYLRKKGTDEVYIRTERLAERDDMEPYYGPASIPKPVTAPNGSFLAEAIENDEPSLFYKLNPSYSYIPNPSYEYRGPLPDGVWVKIKETYKLLLAATNEETFPATLASNNIYKSNADDLRKFFTNTLGKWPKFLFPDNGGSGQVQPTKNEDKEQSDFDSFIRGLKVSYESDREIKIQVPGQKAKCFNHEAFGFRDSTTLEWKTLIDILQTPGLTYAFGPAYTHSEDGAGRIKKANLEYSATRKRIESINKELVVFLVKQYNIKAPKNYMVYERLRGRPGTVQLKFKQELLEQVFAASIDGGYNGYSREGLLKNLKELANNKKTPNAYLSKRIEEAKQKGITKEELEDILPPSRSTLLS